MAEVFISYAHADREKIQRLAAALTSEGFDVWWDRNLAGGAEFSRELERQLEAAQIVLVAWSTSSVDSNWVADEATEGRDRGCLVPIAIDEARPRIGFRQFQTLKFSDWKGDPGAPQFLELVGLLKAKLGGDSTVRSPVATSKAPTGHAWKLWACGFTAIAAVLAVLIAMRPGSDETTKLPGRTEAVSGVGVETPVPDQSIAILPFADRSAEQDQAYFSEGVAEEILNVLTRVDRLKVASRTSSFRYKSRDDMVSKTIASDLGVRHLLDGSVRKAGETIRVTVRLIDSVLDETIWSRTFDKVLTVENVLSIQDEVAISVVEELGGKIGIGSADTLRFAAAAATDNLSAYEIFLEGRELFSRRHTENLPMIVAKFEEAVRLDPDFSRAWEALAAAYSVSPGWGLVDRAYDTLAIDAANRALALKPDLALAHAVIGANAIFEGAPDYVRSIDQYSRAIELDRHDPTPWSWRGQELAELGFFKAAESDLRRALELDPTSQVAKLWLVRTYLYAGQLEAATHAFLQLDQEMRHPGHVRPLMLSLAAEGKEALVQELRAQTSGFGIQAAMTTDLVLDENFDFETGYAAFMALMKKHYGYALGQTVFADWLHSYKRFAQMQPHRPTSGQTVWWYRYHEEFLSSPHRYRMIRDMGIERYWREKGFPPQCRPLNEDQIECL